VHIPPHKNIIIEQLTIQESKFKLNGRVPLEIETEIGYAALKHSFQLIKSFFATKKYGLKIFIYKKMYSNSN